MTNGGDGADTHSHLDKLRNELCHALGEAVWAFSMVERLTYQYMASLSAEPLHELMADQAFNSRVKLIKRLIDRLEGQEAEKAYALKYLKRAEQLAGRRNMIAHNPWQISIDFDTRGFEGAISKFGSDAGALNVADVRQFAVDTQETASGLRHALSRLRYCPP